MRGFLHLAVVMAANFTAQPDADDSWIKIRFWRGSYAEPEAVPEPIVEEDRGVGSRPVIEFLRDWLGGWTLLESEPNPAGVPSGEGHSEQSENAGDHWFVTFWLNLLFKVADTGFVYCGALCASVGYAAKWAYWLAVAVVGVFCLQLAVWTISWVVIPVLRHTYAFYRKFEGGARIENPSIYQHGYLARCNGVHSSSHRYWRNQIEVAECAVHLCSADPCTAPDCAEVHVGLSAVAPRSEEVDLQEVAGKEEPAALPFAVACGELLARAAAAQGDGTSTTIRRLNSEGGEGDHICQADQVALGGPEAKGPLSLGPCKDCSCGPPIRLLQPDERTSCTEDLMCENDGYYFRACQRHRDMYEASRAKRACAVEGCNNAARSVLKGVRLCKLHSAKEERGPKPQSEAKGPRAVGDVVKEASKEEATPQPEARSAPGQGSTDSVNPATTGNEQGDSKDLAAYLQARLNGESHSVAFLGTAKRDESLVAASRRLTAAAKAALRRLPPDYPEEVAQLIRSLAGAREKEEAFDPILELGKRSLALAAAEPTRPAEEHKPESSVVPFTVSAALLFRQKEASRATPSDGASAVPLPDGLVSALRPSRAGKELFHSLKTAGAQGRPQMRALQFPVNVTNRVAYGLASLSIGGREVKSLPGYALSVADFPLTSEEDFDNFVPPPDSRLEKRPRHPTTLTAWFRAALRMAWAVACVYGTEHYALFEAAATKLLHLGEEATYAWPLPWVMSTWEELWSRMVEELRQLDREMRRLMGEESPSWERIRFYCTSPDDQGNPWLRLPRTFDLEDPKKEFFASDIVPRHQRALTRNCWQQALKAQGLGTTSQLGGGRAGGDFSEEGTAAVTQTDAKEGGGYLCWDYMSHRGCHLGAKCPHAHPPASQIPAWNSLDWSVQLQLFRRGGLKTKAKTKSVDAAVAALRREVARKQQEHVEEGQRQAAAAAKSTEGPSTDATIETPPPEKFTSFAPTDAEATLEAWEEGPDFTWFADQSAPAVREVDASVVTRARQRPEARHRVRALDAVTKEASLEGWPALLATFVKAHLVRRKESHPGEALSSDHVFEALRLAVAEGGPELATQAEVELERTEPVKAGESVATFSEAVAAGDYLKCEMRWGSHSWPVADYGDRLCLLPGVSDQVRGAPSTDEPEGRQCLVLHCVAGVLLRKQGRLPTSAEVASAAAVVRKELLERAVSSDTALGPVPEELSRAETNLRIYAHDLRHWAHDKDYRCLAAYPLAFFSRHRLVFLRVGPRGHVTAEQIRGADAPASSEPIVLVIHQGHMRLLHAAPGVVDGAFPHPRVVPALGWADLLE
ncbi:unnamed protein product, partial [Symbiodinium necroappetens]